MEPCSVLAVVILCAQALLAGILLQHGQVEHAGRVHVEQPLPPVHAVRSALIDWHDLKYGGNRGGSLGPRYAGRELVDYISDTTGVVQRLPGGDVRPVGWDHGYLRAYSMCAVVADPCTVHARAECAGNDLCGWCPSRQLCVDATNPALPSSGQLSCPEWKADQKFLIASGSSPQPQYGYGRGPPPARALQACGGTLLAISPTGSHTIVDAAAAEAVCNRTVVQPATLATPNEEAQAMLSHWYMDFLTPLTQTLAEPTHVVLTPMHRREAPAFWDTLGLFTPFCYRRQAALVGTTCFCRAQPAPQAPKLPDAYHLAASRVLGVPPPPRRLMPRLAIVARQGQHFILNQDSLLSAAREAGYLADVLPLERMTVNEQIHALRTVRRPPNS